MKPSIARERCTVVVSLGGVEHAITRTRAIQLVEEILAQLDVGDVAPFGALAAPRPGFRFMLPGPFKPWERARRTVHGGHYTSEASEAAQNAIALFATRSLQAARVGGLEWDPLARLAVSIRVRWRDARRRDLDNVAKQIDEGLMRTGGLVLDDDAQIDRLLVERLAPGADEHVEVAVTRKDGNP